MILVEYADSNESPTKLRLGVFLNFSLLFFTRFLLFILLLISFSSRLPYRNQCLKHRVYPNSSGARHILMLQLKKFILHYNITSHNGEECMKLAKNTSLQKRIQLFIRYIHLLLLLYAMERYKRYLQDTLSNKKRYFNKQLFFWYPASKQMRYFNKQTNILGVEKRARPVGRDRSICTLVQGRPNIQGLTL